nr:DUF4383 domain-containing protein [Amycolatopsis antarctica]
MTALVVVVVYSVLGIAGVMSADEATDSNSVLFFSAAAMTNTVHLVVSVIGLLVVWKPHLARPYGLLLFFVFAGLTAYGTASAITASATDTVTVTWADNIVHATTSAVGLWLALRRDTSAVKGGTTGTENIPTVRRNEKRTARGR